ncbi:unnamed protein product [Hymenolepis diminuta]|uniref:Transcription initiation factor IIA subunit 1 n=3 Tax=Hymenolepis diminuta TaxID=6216 RepID=A0A564YQW1_HYMDI|nr:unnamed protein product [Hymenolepis diminuta]
MSEIAAFYNKVIDDVIEGVKEAFLQDGVDLDVLEQLKKLWISKFAETHVTDPEPAAQPASHYARVLGPQMNPVAPVPIARMPLQLPVPGSLRNLAPIARPNAPLPAVPVATSTNQQTGLVMSPSQQQRPAIVLASALNTQSTNPQAAFANIAFRPQPNAPGQQAAIIGQPTLAGVNGMAAFQGQNIQFVQLSQPLMMPFQLRPQTVIQTQPHQQQQNFTRSQVDGAGDGVSDFSDEEEAEVLEPYSVETPLLRSGPMSLIPAHPTPTPQRQFLSETPTRQTSATGAVGGGDDSDDDDEGMVPPTPHPLTTPGGDTPAITVGKRCVGDATTTLGGTMGEKRARFLSLQESFGHEDSDADVISDPDDFDPDQLGMEATAETVVTKTSRRKQKKPLRGGGHEDEHIPDRSPETKLEDEELPPPPEEPEDGAEGEEEEEDKPLNSEDDVSDEDADLIFRSEDLVVCQYERFTRARSRWRFWLRDGIMKINGREQVFQRLLVEADWMYNSQQNRAAT